MEGGTKGIERLTRKTITSFEDLEVYQKLLQLHLEETKHHLSVAFQKGYLGKEADDHLAERYDEFGRMLRGLEQSLERRKP